MLSHQHNLFTRRYQQPSVEQQQQQQFPQSSEQHKRNSKLFNGSNYQPIHAPPLDYSPRQSAIYGQLNNEARKWHPHGNIVHSVHYYELGPNANPHDIQPKVLQKNGATEVYVPIQRRRRHDRKEAKAPMERRRITRPSYYTDIPAESDQSVEVQLPFFPPGISSYYKSQTHSLYSVGGLCSPPPVNHADHHVVHRYKNYTTVAVQTQPQTTPSNQNSRRSSGNITRNVLLTPTSSQQGSNMSREGIYQVLHSPVVSRRHRSGNHFEFDFVQPTVLRREKSSPAGHLNDLFNSIETASNRCSVKKDEQQTKSDHGTDILTEKLNDSKFCSTVLLLADKIKSQRKISCKGTTTIVNKIESTGCGCEQINNEYAQSMDEDDSIALNSLR